MEISDSKARKIAIRMHDQDGLTWKETAEAMHKEHGLVSGKGKKFTQGGMHSFCKKRKMVGAVKATNGTRMTEAKCQAVLDDVETVLALNMTPRAKLIAVKDLIQM